MNRRNRIQVMVAAAAMLLLMSASVQLSLADHVKTWRGPEGQKQVILPTDSVTVGKKTLTSVFATGGQEYALTTGTIIVSPDGNQVSIRRMLVPCDVEITYKNKGNVREAQRITIKQIHSNASWQWTSKQSE